MQQSRRVPRTLALLVLSLAIAAAAMGAGTPPTPLPNAHAHNDYEHSRPLLDALSQGFCSVEADIYLVNGKLLVAHNREDVRPEKTLEALYLEPLQQRVRANGGWVYRNGPAFSLLIDIKGDAEPTYHVLRKSLEPYRAMLTRYERGKSVPGAVSIILSGNRPRAEMEAEETRLAALDGRLSDLGAGASPALVAWISDNWQLNFRWRGTGPLAPEERTKLEDLVQRAHAEGYRLRFWAAPDAPEGWTVLKKAGVDLINTDHLEELAAHLRKLDH